MRAARLADILAARKDHPRKDYYGRLPREHMGLTLFRNARICTPRDQGAVPAEPTQGALIGWEKGAMLCRDGRIVTIGDEAAILGAIGTARGRSRPYARARAMVDMGLPVALATDCNPGSSVTESVPFVFAFAVLQMGLTVSEALTGVTLNAAYALGEAERRGSLTPGKAADFLLLEGETPAILAFRPGVSPVSSVYKRGSLTWRQSEAAGKES